MHVPVCPFKDNTPPMGRMRAARLLAAGLLPLAGCGGAGGSGGGTGPIPPSWSAYEERQAALQAQWGSIAPTAPASLPYSGSAHYAGVLRLRAEQAVGERLMDGSLALDVSFASGTFSGSAGSFVDSSGTLMSGSLSVSGGVIDRAADLNTGYTYSANLDGTLSGPADSFQISADLSGDFRGSAWQAASGVVAGTAQSAGLANGYLFGDFIAAR